jgi:hypothetical protein
VITEWYKKELLAQARAEFDGLLRRLSKYRAKDWNVNDYKPLTGKQAGLYELRFKADKRSIARLGSFYLQPMLGAQTLMCWCY